jgi:hypothetical protein
MEHRMPVPIAPLLSTSLFVAAASGLPSIDLRQICMAAEKAMIQSSGSTTDRTNFDACMKSEQSAREQLARDWSTYPAADRAKCIQPAAYMPSYVEWLTCLEIAREVRRIQKD